jgi:hypothetical protein
MGEIGIYRRIIFLIIIFNAFLFSQENEIANSTADINAFGNPPSIDYTITFKNAIDFKRTLNELAQLKFSLNRISDNAIVYGTQVKKTANDKAIKLILVVPNDSTSGIVKEIFSQDFPTYISVSEDINIYMPGENNPFTITKDVLKELTFSSKTLTDDKMTMLLQYLNGNSLEIINNINFSKEVNNADSTLSEYILDFDVQKPLLSNILGLPIFYELKGRLSTNNFNPLNILSAYVRYRYKDNFFFEAGRTGPQKFTKNAVRVNLGYENVIPNLIDLTGGSPRFRLKPYIKFGASFEQNFYEENAFGKKGSNFLVFFEGYYYVPVLDKFALIFNANGNYSDKFITNDKFLFNYSITFGYETPLENLNVLFKVADGETEVNIGKDTIYSLGLLLNFIPY